MVLVNLPQHLRTKTENIKLVALVLDSYITKYGWERVLQKIVADLKVLETMGISLMINDECKTFLGTLIAMLGDNLGSHQIGGFVENFSKSLNFRRYCEIPRNEFNANIFCRRKLRTIQSYIECANEAEEEKRIVKGIKRNSVLNQLNYYHVATPGLPPFLAHDIFEGFVKKDLFLAIQYFVTKKGWFTAGFLNFRLSIIRLLSESIVLIPAINVIRTEKKNWKVQLINLEELSYYFQQQLQNQLKILRTQYGK